MVREEEVESSPCFPEKITLTGRVIYYMITLSDRAVVE